MADPQVIEVLAPGPTGPMGAVTPGSQATLDTLTAFTGGTATDSGALTGAEHVAVSKGAGLLRSTLTTIAKWAIETYTGFVQLGTGAIARAVLAKLRDYSVSASDYGAVGDGVADDSVPIQKAIDYLYGKGGGVVFLPGPATYRCNLVMKSGVTLRTDSEHHGYLPQNVSNVTLKQAGPGFVVDTPSTLIHGAAIKGINFKGLGAATPGGGVQLQNAKWCSVKECSFDNFADQAVLHVAGFACNFEKLLGTNILMNRTRTQISGCLETYGTDDYIDKVEMSASLGAIFDAAHMYLCGLVLGGANHFVGPGVVGEFAERGIYVAPVNGTGHRIIGARADSNVGYGFYNDGSAQFAACFAYHNSTGNAGAYSGFYASATASTSKYSACQSDGVNGTNIKYGFEDASAYSDPNSKNDYLGCTSLYNQSGTFSFNSTSGAGSVISGKSTVPANGTTNPSVEGVRTVNLSGYTTVTTITQFIKGSGGQTIKVLGSSKVTLANGSGIVTPTGANYPLADNTVYTLTFIAGFWYMG